MDEDLSTAISSDLMSAASPKLTNLTKSQQSKGQVEAGFLTYNLEIFTDAANIEFAKQNTNNFKK